MCDNNKVKKNVCANLVHITGILEQTSITDKTDKFYTASTKNNISVPQDINKKISTHILENTIPVCNVSKRAIHSQENKFTKIQYQSTPVVTTNNMRDNNKVKKNVSTNLVQISGILEQTYITDKTDKFYTASTIILL